MLKFSKNKPIRKMENGKWKVDPFEEKGLGIVEIIVVIAIITTAFIAILQLATLEQRAQILARQDVAAYITARESVEATRSIRDEDWVNISSLSYSTPYYPVLTSSVWELSLADPGPVNGYNRWIEVEEVFRDADDNIATSGVSDPDTVKVTSYVTWTAPGGDTRDVQIEAYLTNWQGYR